MHTQLFSGKGRAEIIDDRSARRQERTTATPGCGYFRSTSRSAASSTAGQRNLYRAGLVAPHDFSTPSPSRMRAHLLLNRSSEAGADVYSRSKFSTISAAPDWQGARRHWMAIGIPIAIVLLLAYVVRVRDRRAAAPIHRDEDESRAEGLHRAHRKAQLSPAGLLARSPRRRDHAGRPPRARRFSASSASAPASTGRPCSPGASSAMSRSRSRRSTSILPQARKEIDDPTPVRERGWQEALRGGLPAEDQSLRDPSG